jgi:hypothetical protein
MKLLECKENSVFSNNGFIDSMFDFFWAIVDLFDDVPVVVDALEESLKEEIEEACQPINDTIECINEVLDGFFEIPLIKFKKAAEYADERKRLLKDNIKSLVKSFFKAWVRPVIVNLVSPFLSSNLYKERLSSVKKLKPQY